MAGPDCPGPLLGISPSGPGQERFLQPHPRGSLPWSQLTKRGQAAKRIPGLYCCTSQWAAVFGSSQVEVSLCGRITVKQDEATVFVIDPDLSTRDVVRSVTCTMNLNCETYESGQQFIDAYSSSKSGCVIMEFRVPDISGLEIQKHLTSLEPVPPIVFLTSHATVSIAVRAMRSGALYLLEKPARENELWDIISEAVRLDDRQREQWRARQETAKQLACLSPKERHVLSLAADGKTKKAIAAEMDVCLRTVEIHRSQAMRKLGLKTPEELVYFAVVSGNGRS